MPRCRTDRRNGRHPAHVSRDQRVTLVVTLLGVSLGAGTFATPSPSQFLPADFPGLSRPTER